MENAQSRTPRIVVMGVSGSGKSTIGELLAATLQADFLDADTLHPVANIEKMAAGIPLTDEDRLPWISRVGDALAGAGPEGRVVACSALRHSYRRIILAISPATVFLHLGGSPATLSHRLANRTGHFMPTALLESQMTTLEPLRPEEPGVMLDIDQSIPDLVLAAANQWCALTDISFNRS